MGTEFTIHYDDVPPSLNRMGTRGNRFAVTREKKRWEGLIGMLLIAAKVPKGATYVRASATLRFPAARRRDPDNFAWLLTKALGDALQVCGVLPDDTQDEFEFTGLRVEDEKGPKRTTLHLELLDKNPHEEEEHDGR